MKRDDRHRLFALGNRLWHSDSSFRAVPAKYSILSGRIVPARGGDTEFADMRAAYDALDAATRATIEDLVCEHSMMFSRGQLGFTGAVFSDDLSMEGARHLDGGTLTYAEAAVEALEAGCDLVLLCNQSADGGAAVDALLDGLAEAAAAGRWRPNPDAEQRRAALLPSSLPLAWDELMHDPAYQRSLERLP